MIRRPRFPLALRLGWMESELTAAAKLLPAMIADLKDLRGKGDDTAARTMILASVAAAALLLMGVDARTLQEFVDAMGPEGDVDDAEELGAEVLEIVFAMLASTDGQPH